jgi:glyoxylase-like metal-dependent hydrolase (beta-lactamase superfamily II)
MFRLLAIAASAAFCALALGGSTYAQQPDYETTRLAEGVYQFRYQSHNAMFVATGEGVIAFDPISVEAARIYREEIGRVTSEPIVAIVYSHHHADHITGAAELAANVPIYAHQLCYENLLVEQSPDIPLPNRTFSGEMMLRIGGKAIRLIYLGRNHSDNSIVAHLPEQGIIFAVDFVSNGRVGYRDLPGFFLPDLWESLERMQQLEYDLAIFGHGEPGTKSDVYEQINYWTDLREAVESMLRAGLSEDEAVDAIELPAYSDWSGYDDWFKMNARTVFQYYAGIE